MKATKILSFDDTNDVFYNMFGEAFRLPYYADRVSLPSLPFIAILTDKVEKQTLVDEIENEPFMVMENVTIIATVFATMEDFQAHLKFEQLLNQLESAE